MERHFYLYTVVSFNKHKKHPAVSVDPAHKRYHCQNVTAFRNDFVENCSLDIKQKPLTYSRIHFKDINRVWGVIYEKKAWTIQPIQQNVSPQVITKQQGRDRNPSFRFGESQINGWLVTPLPPFLKLAHVRLEHSKRPHAIIKMNNING